jgi:hypothetical protein
MLLSLVFQYVGSLGIGVMQGVAAAGLIVRLRREHAGAYPWVPMGVWLAAHRRVGDDGEVWLDGRALSMSHIEIRELDDRTA